MKPKLSTPRSIRSEIFPPMRRVLLAPGAVATSLHPEHAMRAYAGPNPISPHKPVR
jgi:hypothetical protein